MLPLNKLSSQILTKQKALEKNDVTEIKKKKTYGGVLESLDEDKRKAQEYKFKKEKEKTINNKKETFQQITPPKQPSE